MMNRENLHVDMDYELITPEGYYVYRKCHIQTPALQRSAMSINKRQRGL